MYRRKKIESINEFTDLVHTCLSYKAKTIPSRTTVHTKVDSNQRKQNPARDDQERVNPKEP